MCLSLINTDVMKVYEICLQGNPEEHTILEFARLIKSLVGKVSSIKIVEPLKSFSHFTCPIFCLTHSFLRWVYASV